METDKATLKLFIASMGMIIILEALAVQVVQALGIAHSSAQTLVMVGLLRTLEILFMIMLAHYFTKGLDGIGLGRDRLWMGFKTGIWGSLGFGLLVLIIGIGLYFKGLNPLRLVAADLPEDKAALILLFVVGGVLGPVAEEIFFRGMCYRYFRKLGILSAIIITTGFFVVAHSIKNSVPVTQIVGGILFALSYEYSKSLATPIIIHVSGNLAIFALSFFFHLIMAGG